MDKSEIPFKINDLAGLASQEKVYFKKLKIVLDMAGKMCYNRRQAARLLVLVLSFSTGAGVSLVFILSFNTGAERVCG